MIQKYNINNSIIKKSKAVEIKIEKKDILWSYGAQIFTFGTAFLTLPPILKHLSPEEIGLNYLFQTILALVTLFDFGFSPQFGRNITYVLSGAQTLQKDGVTVQEDSNEGINYKLFKTLIFAGKRIYAILSLITFFFMITAGTIYLSKVTKNFTQVDHSIWIWLSFLTAVSINIFYNYYNPLLIGKGMIKQNNKILVISRSLYIILIYILIKLNFGLFSLVIGSFASTILTRFLAHRIYFTKDISVIIDPIKVTNSEIIEVFQIIWHNSRKLGLNFVGGFLITKSGFFLAGLYLSLKDIANFGLTTQLFMITGSFSSLMFYTYLPRFNSLRVKGDNQKLINEFSLAMAVFYIIYFLGSLSIIFAGNYILVNFLHSKVQLISTGLMVMLCLTLFLEYNYSFFATLIVTGNKVPFVKANLISGASIILLSLFSLTILKWGLFGIVFSQFIVELCYNTWKWPHFIIKEFKVNFMLLFQKLLFESNKRLTKKVINTNSNTF